ncbi:putative Mg2+ transporter-C (MgtC) family protein [Thermodesulfobium acidiphilum]|uniref:Putative Mg2+ transporter-C (MgtC) family protein n=1 Tax=Thermodesulfobium acidiphilum TaxID=1794699 RepID=A0A2R4VY96_THEAF|nr:MgtC/SapB family protein [Thermodesulfobium acidiphilum]AWB09458.1 putative Mg2+ transporter-C (MgtC) family protein [Thermodesulfobium acidiphilum]
MQSLPEIILKLSLAILVGAIFGIERELRGRAAGIRTNILVCLSGTLVMLLSSGYFNNTSDLAVRIQLDPGRIAAGAVTGIGFLGAGVILKTRGEVQGLTTAALIFLNMILGLCIGSGLYLLVAFGTISSLIPLTILRKLSSLIKREIRILNISIKSCDKEEAQTKLSSILAKNKVVVLSHDMSCNFEKEELKVSLLIEAVSEKPFLKIFEELREIKFIKSLSISTKE